MLPIDKIERDVQSIKGFLDHQEGAALYDAVLSVAALGPCVEIGSYCGKSTVYLGRACQAAGTLLYAVDHHRGSEEHQLGEAYHDPQLFDAEAGKMDSFREFRRTLALTALEDTVVPIVAPSTLAARHWATSLSLVFIDGGHSRAAALNDYRCWAPHIVRGGLLAIHDVFPNPADGGRPPFEIWQLAQASGLFEAMPLTKTLGLLRRL